MKPDLWCPAVRSPFVVRALFVSSILFALTGCARHLPESRPHPLLSSAPKVIEEPTLKGEMISFPKKGTVTVVDFWSTVCEPCLKMMPAMEQLHEQHGEGLTVIGVAVDDNPGAVNERLKKLGIRYPNVLDDAGSSRGAYQVDELPQTFIFDKTGKLRVVTKGGADGDVAVIRDAVEFLLAE